jgi:transposase InsO family protein
VREVEPLSPAEDVRYCSPHHPQTQGKLVRFRETLKARLNLLVYTSPGRLHAAMADFIDFYNHRRYHEGLDDHLKENHFYPPPS